MYAKRRAAEEYGISRPALSALIDEWIFSERDRYILKRRLLDGVTFERLSIEIEQDSRFQPLSTRQIQSIAAKGMRILSRHVKIS